MKAAYPVLAAALAAGGFAGGYWFRARPAAAPRPAAGEKKILYYYDPMHPNYRSGKPGTAPDCGMDLVPMYEGGAPAAEAEAPPPGTIHIPPEKQQLIGVTIGEAGMWGGEQTIRAAGRVQADETRVAHVHTRTEGWIDQVFADFTGKQVNKGDPLLTIYSPELVSAQQEYLLALNAKETLAHSPLTGTRGQTASLIQASRRRLELWNLNEDQIAEVERTGRPVRNLTLYSPASGHITMRNAFPNQMAKPEMELYTIVDLSRVWVVADVFESEMGQVRTGSHARITAPSAPGRPWHGRVSYILPQVDPATRTGKVRIEAANPGLELKPDMFVEVDLPVPIPAQLTVPASAVIDSGLRQTVFVDRGNGYFEPRQVKAGGRFEDRVVILSGLKAGERIATSGVFLLDSESQIKAAVSGASGGHQHAAPVPPPSPAPAQEHHKHD